MTTCSEDSQPPKKDEGPVCPACKGSRFVHPALPDGKPDFSRAVACHCVRQASNKDRKAQLEQYSSLGSLKRFTFENLSEEGLSGKEPERQNFKHAFEAAKAFAKEPKGWLVITGPSASGKTHLAAAIASSRLELACPALYRTVPDLLDDLRAAFSPDAEKPYDRTFEQVRSAPLLILDDLGIQSSTAWAKEKLDQLINYRFNQELPTVITLSTPLEKLEERMHHRLTDSRLSQILNLETKEGNSLDYEWAHGLELQKNMTFGKFDWRRMNLPPEQRQNLEQAYRLALEYAKSPDGWLVLQGDTGSGKTHLAAAIVNYRYDSGQPARFVVVPEFLDHLRSTFTPDSKVSYDRIFEKVKTSPLLVLDDFGEQASTPWANEKLYQVINYRYNAQLPTIITTRRSIGEIDDPVGSRFVDPKISVAFNLTVPDYRGDLHSHKETTPSRQKKGRRS